MRFRRVVLMLTIGIFTAGAAGAADLAIPPRLAPQNSAPQNSAPKELAPKDVSVQTGPANCSRWTDECVNCTRGAKDEPAVCSNIGFACQPKAIRCLGAQ